MASQEFVDFSMQGSEGTKMPRAKWNHVSRHQIPYFTENEQKAIAHILGSLDDKIELNRRMNETLEAMAQALFKSWFVDFDPVIDNALAAGNEIPEELKERTDIREALGDAHKPLPEKIQNLFPSEFEHTEEMGWIPKGWSTTTIEEIAEKVAMGPFGSSIKVSTFVPLGIPIISGQHLKLRFPNLRHYANQLTKPHLKNTCADSIFSPQ